MLVYSVYFIFPYSNLFGDKTHIKKLSIQKKPLPLPKKVQIRMKDWEDKGYMYCIKKNAVIKFNKDQYFIMNFFSYQRFVFYIDFLLNLKLIDFSNSISSSNSVVLPLLMQFINIPSFSPL